MKKVSLMAVYGVFLVTLVVPFSIDIFIASFPQMREYFQGQNVSLLMSVFLLGFALAQPFYGPFLDRFGRKPVLLCGLSLYTISSAVLVFSSNFSLLVGARFFQALGGCSCTICAFAVARDTFRDEQLIKATGLIMTLIGVSPALAPLVGALLAHRYSWRASFIFLFIVGLFFVIFVSLFFKETIVQKNYKATNIKHALGIYSSLFANMSLMHATLISALTYGILFSYFNLSSLFVVQQMGVSGIMFGVLIGVMILPLIVISSLVHKMSQKISPFKLIILGKGFILFSGLLMMFFHRSHQIEPLWCFVLSMEFSILGMAFVRPCVSAWAMGSTEKNVAGFTSALFNFVGFLFGSLSTYVTSLWVKDVFSYGAFLVFLAILSLILGGNYTFRIKKREERKLNIKVF